MFSAISQKFFNMVHLMQDIYLFYLNGIPSVIYLLQGGLFMIWIKFMLTLSSVKYQVGVNYDCPSRNHGKMKRFTNLAAKTKNAFRKIEVYPEKIYFLTKIYSIVKKNILWFGINHGSPKMLSEKDVKIISHLRKNSRMKLTELSQVVGIPVTTLYSKLQGYEKSVIRKHTSLMNFSQLGYKSVYFVLKAKERRKELQEFLQQHQNINSLLRTNYDTDFLLEGIFQNEKEVNDFLEELQEKFEPRIQMLNVIEEIRKEEFMSRKGDDETWN